MMGFTRFQMNTAVGRGFTQCASISLAPAEVHYIGKIYLFEPSPSEEWLSTTTSVSFA